MRLQREREGYGLNIVRPRGSLNSRVPCDIICMCKH